jgi:pimeloyl-ACP methyl ester carboxylesterase
MAAVETMLTDDLRHIEVYTVDGLLSLFWHGPSEAQDVVLACGGAMGGVLGPADALYQDLGVRLAESGVGTIRVGYRAPNDIEKCVHDLVAAADLATRSGAQRFITMGHSFGGAPALQAAVILQEHCAGVITLATQSAGCEPAEDLATRVPVILFHGDKDEILPLQASELVHMVVGGGELVPLAGVGHLLAEARDELRGRLSDWIPEKFREHAER